MYIKDRLVTIQSWALVLLTVSASVLMLSLSFVCFQYQAAAGVASYEVNICPAKDISDVD